MTANLALLNSATKYPSIPTYHEAERGNFHGAPIVFPDGCVFTEKVHGTNTRMIFMPDGNDYFLGSREHLLHAKGDRVLNSTEHITETLKPIADQLTENNLLFKTQHTATVVYGEVYGGGIGPNAKQYSKTGQYGFRLFDVCSVDLEHLEGLETLEQVAHWRDSQGGQEWYDEDELQDFARGLGLDRVPILGHASDNDLPQSIEDTWQWVKTHLSATQVGLDHSGVSEGLVLRNHSRSVTAKVRIEDYDKHMRRQEGTDKGRNGRKKES